MRKTRRSRRRREGRRVEGEARLCPLTRIPWWTRRQLYRYFGDAAIRTDDPFEIPGGLRLGLGSCTGEEERTMVYVDSGSALFDIPFAE